MSGGVPPTCQVRRFGVENYLPLVHQMREFTASRDPSTPDEIWLLQHHPVYTLGQAGKREHILDPHDIPVVQSDRGGQVTYHGPGQLVAYLLVDVRRRDLGIRRLVDLCEKAVIAVLADFGITGETQPGAPGVYVRGEKIAALGLRIRNGRSYHGLSFNIDMDLAPFGWINPCGYPGLQSTTLKDLLGRLSHQSLAAARSPEALFPLAQEKLLRELLAALL